MDYKYFFLINLTILFLFQSCYKHDSSRTEFALGTVCTVTLYEQGKDHIYRDIFSRLREIDNLMSINIDASDISRINSAAGIKPVQVHDDVFTVIEKAIYYAQISDGAFDPSIGPVVSLWGINNDKPYFPSKEEIEEILPLVSWKDIEIDPDTKSIYLKKKGMALDLGAIAKGYAADEAAAILKRYGIKRAIIDLGGNIVVFGENRDMRHNQGQRPWRVGIQNPDGERGTYIGIIQIPSALEQKSIVTSGVYERFFEKDGQKFHHIFSSATGYPADNELASVTVISPDSIKADALSTAVFVMGYEKGKALVDSISEAEAIFVFKDGSVQKTSGVDFQLSKF